jgi:hypothetical protein
VSVRVDGDAIHVDVALSAEQPPAARADDGDTSARISLRLSETLKADIEQAAAREGTSVNSWLVRAASTALSPGSARTPWSDAGRRGTNIHRVTGWING